MLGKWLNQNSVVNAIVNGHGEFYDKMKSLSEITPIADNQDHGYSVQPTLDFDAFNLDDDKQSFDIDVAMKSFRPTSADPERLFSLNFSFNAIWSFSIESTPKTVYVMPRLKT